MSVFFPRRVCYLVITRTSTGMAGDAFEKRKEKEVSNVASNKWIRTAKAGYIVISVLLCVFGIVLILIPDISAALICRIGGFILILFGTVKIISYCSRDLYRLAFQYDLALGILLIALGAILIVRTRIMMNAICIFLGIYILADALLKIQISIDSKTFGLRRWWLILAAAVVTGIFGFLLVFCPSEGTRAILLLLGISLLTEGILNLITILNAVKIIRRQMPVIMDGEYEEI